MFNVHSLNCESNKLTDFETGETIIKVSHEGFETNQSQEEEWCAITHNLATAMLWCAALEYLSLPYNKYLEFLSYEKDYDVWIAHIVNADNGEEEKTKITFIGD